MQFREAIKIALDSLRVNRLRSVLTLLGVVIGVMTVITVVAFISGMNAYVEGEILTLGADVFYITRTPEIILSEDEWIRVRQRKNLLLDDAHAVRQHCTSCQAVGARRNAGARAKYGSEEIPNVQIRGLTPEVPEILGEELDAGREVTDYDVRQSRRVAVVGADIVENLFPLVDPLGKRVSVNGREFEIVGIGETVGPVLGQSRDNWIAIPISSFEKMWGSRGSVTVLAKAGGEESIESAQDEARAVLRVRRHVPFGDDDDFSIQTNDTFRDLWASLSQTFFAVTIAIASISLVVGGIVVMNIMLVSVTERTREIGVRKAIGARKVDILMQVLIESATLTGIGGVIGVALAAILATSVSSVTGFPAVIQAWSVLLGLGVSTIVGLFFGIWPARKAAALDPIAALRSE
jgi:putative ABC transport system permease protein